MCPLLLLIFHYWQLISINFLINFLICFFIIAINLFESNYLLLLEGMAVHPMLAGRASVFARLSRWDSTVRWLA
jgi:hypothetical protein